MRTASKVLVYALFISICIVLLGIAVLMFGRIDRTIEGFGMVSPVRQVDVAPEIGGIIKAVLVREGDTVSRSDTLFVIHSHELEFTVEQTGKALADARASLQRTVEEYNNITTSRSYEIGVILADLNEAEQRMNYYKANFERAAELHERGIIEDAQFEKARLDYESSKSYLEILQSRIRIVKRQYERLIEERRMDLEITEHAHELARRNLEKTVVTSPMDGVVLTRRPERLVGTRVNAGEPALAVGDLSNLDFIVNVNEVDITGVRVGQRARIFLNSFPHRQYKVFMGAVAEISSIPQVASNTVAYEVRITIDEPWVEKGGERIGLRFGLRGRVEIVTEPDIRLLRAIVDGVTK